MKPDPERSDVVLCADLIAPEGYGEIIGGSQRIDDLELMEQRYKEHGLTSQLMNGTWSCVNTAVFLTADSDWDWKEL